MKVQLEMEQLEEEHIARKLHASHLKTSRALAFDTQRPYRKYSSAYDKIRHFLSGDMEHVSFSSIVEDISHSEMVFFQ